MAIAIGTKAPGFQLPSKPGNVRDVSAVLGTRKVVLLFFPLSFSGTCTAEMCHFRDDWARWSELDCAIFGITVDSPFVTDKFRQELGVPFEILSDFNRTVSPQYGALYAELNGLKGVTKRAAFVMDAAGVVRYAKVNEVARDQVDFNAIREAVESC